MSESSLSAVAGPIKAGETYHDKAYDYIKANILNMSYKPGQSLSEVEICRELGISRTPVREALRRLTSEGLVTWVSGRGCVVYTLSLHDIEEIFDMKEALEGFMVRQVALKRTDEDLERLSDCLSRMETAAGEGNVDEWLRRDREYHAILYGVLNNERIRQTVENLNEQWHRLRLGFVTLEGRLVQSTKEHRALLEAIALGDSDSAERAAREHFSNLRSTLMSLVKNFVIPYVGENL